MNNYICINFVYIRKSHHLSQIEMGDKIGATSHSVSAYERNKAYPNIEVIQRLCNEFNVSIDDFVNKDLSKPIEKEYNIPEIKEPYPVFDNKTEAMYERIVSNYQELILLKDKLLKEKDKTALANIRTIEAL